MKSEYKLENYDGDIVITGVGLNAQAVEAIKAELSAETLKRVIGWRSFGSSNGR